MSHALNRLLLQNSLRRSGLVSEEAETQAREAAKAKIAQLLDNYNRLKAEQKLDTFNEPQTKSDFIEPLFEALGWDMRNLSHPIAHEVTYEEKVSKGRADYGFRVDGIIRFYLEAKSMKEGVGNDEFVKQAITYSWNKDCAWSVLTDFKTLRIFNAQWHTEDLSQNHVKTIECRDYLHRFDELWLLSKMGLQKGLLDKEAESWGKKMLHSPVGMQLLEDFTDFRELLSKSVTRLNSSRLVNQESLDEAVQTILNRLIFMRSCEDRGLEESKLIPIVRQGEDTPKKHPILASLRELFSWYDSHYDSRLFLEDLCDRLEIDDDSLKTVIEGMKYPAHRLVAYDFSVIEADVLGNIYEQYLGHILRKTEKRAVLTESHSHRKQQGIYYTPTRIVDYIIHNALGELTKDGKKGVYDLRILDPACGSGSFLIKAFDYVCDYGGRQAGSPVNISAKLGILKNCIYGVDLDRRAVEIAQLNLLLKVAEIRQLLPMLQNNVRQGNSLVDRTLDDESVQDRSFDWHKKFSEVFEKHDGFDAITGNPPWVFSGSDEEGITPAQKAYFRGSYESARERKMNLFSLFVERSLSILHEGGLLGFIVPNTLLRVTSYEGIRRYILAHAKILQIVNLEAGVFQDVTASTIILILQKEGDPEKRRSHMVKVFPNGISSYVIERPQVDFQKNAMCIFDITSFEEVSSGFFRRLEEGSVPLGDLCKEMIFGVVITKNFDEVVASTQKSSKYKPFLEGRDISRYRINFHQKYLHYDESKLHRARTPEVFETPEKILVQRIAGGRRPLKAAYDNQQYYDKESINNIILSDKRFSVFYILALLNSSLFSFYYAKKFSNESALTVNVSKAYLSKLPIRDIPPEEQKPIASLAEQMLALQRKLGDIPEHNRVQREEVIEEIGVLDDRIDEEVFSLYHMDSIGKKAVRDYLGRSVKGEVISQEAEQEAPATKASNRSP